MCFKFGAVNSGQESSSEKAEPSEVILKSDYIPVWRWRNAVGLGFSVPRTGPLEVMVSPLCAREGRRGGGRAQ